MVVWNVECTVNGWLTDIGGLEETKDTLKELLGSSVSNGYYADPKKVFDEGNFSNFTGFTALEKIVFVGSYTPTIINGIENITNLKYLNLGVNEITNISNLHSLNLMEELYLAENRISSLYYTENGENKSIFENMSHLKTLNLSNNQIEDLSALKPLLNFKGEDRKIGLKKLEYKR